MGWKKYLFLNFFFSDFEIFSRTFAQKIIFEMESAKSFKLILMEVSGVKDLNIHQQPVFLYFSGLIQKIGKKASQLTNLGVQR